MNSLRRGPSLHPLPKAEAAVGAAPAGDGEAEAVVDAVALQPLHRMCRICQLIPTLQIWTIRPLVAADVVVHAEGAEVVGTRKPQKLLLRPQSRGLLPSAFFG